MKTSNIYRVVVIENNDTAHTRGIFCLTAESLNAAIDDEIRCYEEMGYTTEDYQLHKWAERHLDEGWRTVTHLKTLTHVNDWGVRKLHIGYVTYQAH